MRVRFRRWVAAISTAAMLAGCGGGGGGSTSTGGGGSGGGGGTPTPTACSLRDRQNWVLAQMREWYLFPETLPASLDPTPYASVQDYIDALTATARSQGRDRYFTYITSIAEENAYYSSGSSAGFGVRLSYDTGARRVFIAEAFEGAPALAAGLDRGTEILAIGTSSGSLQTVNALMASGGADAVVTALGPSTAGTTRVLRVTDAGGTREVTVAKADYNLTPVSSRYGARIITDGARQVGYVNLRTFIDTADPALRTAFQQFRTAGITDFVIDLRYNGGGLVSIAELMGDLMGANRTGSEVFDYMTFRPEKSSNNSVNYFAVQPQSVSPVRVAFIGTSATASASELVINGFLPYLGTSMALVGGNTYGKPVGQIALDRTACDDRLRVIAFAVENRDHQSNYYNGLAGTVSRTCRAGDDLTRQLGDPAEASTRAALDFLAGNACTAITADSGGGGLEPQGARVQVTGPDAELQPLMPRRPTTPQRELPGLF
ncbi:S41 family peptidase [Sphingomonas canadensis]|uniref:S41 family peptidase n=1 Tax=Sphingomonas canadensis TaxID=1219257 RepID=A0ABW3H269_9SPHN|nr:S41 family peptidase [Sphingomonas canadensis]MCW3834632.1 S41 family peptidase [Sphingomonas canadensis]